MPTRQSPRVAWLSRLNPASRSAIKSKAGSHRVHLQQRSTALTAVALRRISSSKRMACSSGFARDGIAFVDMCYVHCTSVFITFPVELCMDLCEYSNGTGCWVNWTVFRMCLGVFRLGRGRKFALLSPLGREIRSFRKHERSTRDVVLRRLRGPARPVNTGS